MHPTLVATLAAERHADLLRTAENRRRTAAMVGREHRPLMTRAADRLSRSVSGLRARLAASTQPTTEVCCA